MRLIFATALLLSMTGCGTCSRNTALFSGYARVCVEGVSYIQFPSGVSVEYTQEGKLRYCK